MHTGAMTMKTAFGKALDKKTALPPGWASRIAAVIATVSVALTGCGILGGNTKVRITEEGDSVTVSIPKMSEKQSSARAQTVNALMLYVDARTLLDWYSEMELDESNLDAAHSLGEDALAALDAAGSAVKQAHTLLQDAYPDISISDNAAVGDTLLDTQGASWGQPASYGSVQQESDWKDKVWCTTKGVLRVGIAVATVAGVIVAAPELGAVSAFAGGVAVAFAGADAFVEVGSGVANVTLGWDNNVTDALSEAQKAYAPIALVANIPGAAAYAINAGKICPICPGLQP